MSRIGGDEFVIVIGSIQATDIATTVAGKLIEAVSAPILHEEHILHVGASIGISLFPDDAQDSNQLRILADQAMYKIKKSGKNGFGFAESN